MNEVISAALDAWYNLVPFVQTFLVALVIFFAFNFFIRLLRRNLIHRASSPRQKKTINTLSSFLRYFLIVLLVLFIFLSLSHSLKELGLTFGILSAAIGFALQGPITGVAAWIMVIIKKPFEVGDRVTIGEVKGNVKEISMSHIYLEEVGRYGGEEVSGRTIILANSKLFSENIVNYSFITDFILGQVVFTITYESDLEEANRLAMLAVHNHTEHYNEQAKREPHIRMQLTLNGMEIHARYFVPFNLAQIISTKITHDLFTYIKQSKTVRLSYQQHIIHSDKK